MEAFKHPFCYYEILIVVENKYLIREKDTGYFKKGLGLVEKTARNGINGICLPKKEEAELLMQPISVFGCKNRTEKSKINEFTMPLLSLLSEKNCNPKP